MNFIGTLKEYLSFSENSQTASLDLSNSSPIRSSSSLITIMYLVCFICTTTEGRQSAVSVLAAVTSCSLGWIPGN